MVYQRLDSTAALTDCVGIAVAHEAAGIELDRDDFLAVDDPVAGIAHSLEWNAVVGRLNPLDHAACPLPKLVGTRVSLALHPEELQPGDCLTRRPAQAAEPIRKTCLESSGVVLTLT